MEAQVTPVVPTSSATNKLGLTAGLLGIGSVVVGLIGLLSNLVIPGFLFLLCSGLGILMDLAGLVLGIVALVQIKKTPGQTGKGWAITGIVFGALAVILLVVSPVLVIAILTLLGPAIGNVFSKINSSLMMTPPMP